MNIWVNRFCCCWWWWWRCYSYSIRIELFNTWQRAFILSFPISQQYRKRKSDRKSAQIHNILLYLFHAPENVDHEPLNINQRHPPNITTGCVHFLKFLFNFLDIFTSFDVKFSAIVSAFKQLLLFIFFVVHVRVLNWCFQYVTFCTMRNKS